jgi:hypothetical protein
VRVELSFYRRLVSSAWLAEEILGVAEDLVMGKQIIEPILGCPRGSNSEYNLRIAEDSTVSPILGKADDPIMGITFEYAEC